MLSFTPALNYTTAAVPSAIVTADFNSDGKLDLATCADAGQGSVSVLLGDGSGGFGAAQRFVVGSHFSSMAVADFNGDNKLDIVLPDWGSSALHLLLGNGDGTFQLAATRTQWNYVAAVAAGHFNNDGNADLLVTLWDWDSGLPYFQVQLGNGLGDFGDSNLHPWRLGSAPSVGGRPVDLNNDGKLDVVTPEVQMLLGNGDGTLQNESYYGLQPPLNGRAVATGDFTGDGKADVIVAGTSVAVLRGRGDGSFDAPLFHSANGTDHTSVVTADFNGDGKLDAVASNGDTGTVSLMLGNGDGTLNYTGAFVTGTSPSGVTVGDFNRDGRPDVAVSNAVSRTVSVLLNDGNWNVVPPPPVAPALSISDATITEGNTGTTSATFTLTLSKPASAEVSVYYNAANITALAGSDFDYTSGIVFIPAGETSRTITVAVKGDRLPEPTETFAVNLLLPTNATIADSQGIGAILDDEPRISINNVSKSEGNGKTTFTFTVGLAAAYDQAVTVSYATANGTATAGSDYQAKSGSVTFSPGETSKAITVAVTGDKQSESNETFVVNLTGAIGGEITDSRQGLGTILNDDSGGSRGKVSSSVLAFDAAIEDWMLSGRKKRVV